MLPWFLHVTDYLVLIASHRSRHPISLPTSHSTVPLGVNLMTTSCRLWRALSAITGCSSNQLIKGKAARKEGRLITLQETTLRQTWGVLLWNPSIWISPAFPAPSLSQRLLITRAAAGFPILQERSLTLQIRTMHPPILQPPILHPWTQFPH